MEKENYYRLITKDMKSGQIEQGMIINNKNQLINLAKRIVNYNPEKVCEIVEVIEIIK